MSTEKITVGQLAPDFSLPDQDGNDVVLSDFHGKKNIVLFFFPKSFTPGCTKEACVFRVEYAAFQSADSEVIGISADNIQVQGKFAQHHRLPFKILSDADNSVRKRYGVSPTLGFLFGNLLPGRVTFVIDKQGVVRYRFDSQFNSAAHVRNAAAILKKL